MKHSGVSELHDHTNAPLNAGVPLIIERHGRAIGAYIPFREADRAAAKRAASELADTLAALYARTGLNEDELVAAFLNAS